MESNAMDVDFDASLDRFRSAFAAHKNTAENTTTTNSSNDMGGSSYAEISVDAKSRRSFSEPASRTSPRRQKISVMNAAPLHVLRETKKGKSTEELELERIEAARADFAKARAVAMQGLKRLGETAGLAFMPRRSSQPLTEPREFKMHTAARSASRPQSRAASEPPAPIARGQPASRAPSSSRSRAPSSSRMSLRMTPQRKARIARTAAKNNDAHHVPGRGSVLSRKFNAATARMNSAPARRDPLHNNENKPPSNAFAVPVAAANAKKQTASAPKSSVSAPTAPKTRVELTQPRTPKFATSRRVRSAVTPALSTEERELLAIRSAPKFKAAPVNYRVFESAGEVGVPRVAKREITKAKSPKFASDRRILSRHQVEAMQH